MMRSFLLGSIITLSVLFLKFRAEKSPLAQFQASYCGELFKTADGVDRGLFDAILPPIGFWDLFANVTMSDIVLVDVDKYSTPLLLNQVAALKKSDSKLAKNIFAMAYDNSTCNSLTIKGIRCFYDLTWTNRLMGNIRYLTRNQNPGFMHLVMMGRMITTTVLLCEGHNVFLTDSDVLFYRDPIPYIFPEVNIMITATPISSEQDSWGSPFFFDQPKQFYTLNNGVVYYRSNPVTRSFTMTLVAHCMNSFRGRYDHEEGFLQKVFNRMLIDGKLSLHPCSKISNPATFQLNSTHLNNTVGECYDCYYGHIPWWSDVVQLPVVPDHPHVLKIGVFPTQRYTSMCYAPDHAGT